MYVDTQETFSLNQSIVAGVGDVVSTNVFDSGTAHDEGAGEPLFVYVKVGTAVAGATVTPVLQDSADNITFTDVQTAKPVATPAANTEIAKIRLNIGMRRYWRMAYRLSVAAATTGTVSAFVAKDVPVNYAYPTSYSVA